MLKDILKKKQNFIFVCQIGEDVLKIGKFLARKDGQRECSALEALPIARGLSEKELSEAIGRILKKLSYNHNRIVIALARNQATSRYIKVPTQSPDEIESIVALQAPRYLPYPSEELITGYQIASLEKNGYSNINLIITHRDTVERLVRIFKDFKPCAIEMALSSYGLVNFFNKLSSQDNSLTMVANIDESQTEISVALAGKLIFSRSFRLDYKNTESAKLFMEEINKTREACTRETGERLPAGITLVGVKEYSQKLAQELGGIQVMPSRILEYPGADFARHSFAVVIGLGIKDVEPALNLLPKQLKESAKKIARKNEFIKTTAYAAGIIILLSLAVAKNIYNKAMYLSKLKSEIAKISPEAKPLEAKEKSMLYIEQRSRKKSSGLDVLYATYKSIPQAATLVSFTYEEDKQVVMRGQSPELKYIFEMVSRLEKSVVFRNYSIKVRYASKKKVQAGEILDFEIICQKK